MCALYLVGMGLCGYQDLPLKSYKLLKRCDEIYCEFYTNLVRRDDIKELEREIGREFFLLNREDIEEKPGDNIFKNSKNSDVCLLVPGDPLAATCHIEVLLAAQKLGIEVEVFHASSIFSAVGQCGLHLYKFGRATTLVFPEKNYFPQSPYDVICENQKTGLHTLVLLDVRSDESRYMSITDALKLLYAISDKRKSKDKGNGWEFSGDTLCVGTARLGCQNRFICSGKASDLLDIDFGAPPHTLIIPGKLHFTEEQALKIYSRENL